MPMCQVILIVLKHYIQIHVSILFLFEQNGEAHHQWLRTAAENVTSEN